MIVSLLFSDGEYAVNVDFKKLDELTKGKNGIIYKDGFEVGVFSKKGVLVFS